MTAEASRRPQVGDAVWYWPEPTGGPWAAWVTAGGAPGSQSATLYVLHPTDDRRHSTRAGVPWSADREPGSWGWRAGEAR